MGILLEVMSKEVSGLQSYWRAKGSKLYMIDHAPIDACFSMKGSNVSRGGQATDVANAARLEVLACSQCLAPRHQIFQCHAWQKRRTQDGQGTANISTPLAFMKSIRCCIERRIHTYLTTQSSRQPLAQ